MLLVRATHRLTKKRRYLILNNDKELIIRRADNKNKFYKFKSLSEFVETWKDFQILRKLKVGKEIGPYVQNKS